MEADRSEMARPLVAAPFDPSLGSLVQDLDLDRALPPAQLRLEGNGALIEDLDALGMLEEAWVLLEVDRQGIGSVQGDRDLD